MCELLVLSSSQPARLEFSLHTLAARGGLLQLQECSQRRNTALYARCRYALQFQGCMLCGKDDSARPCGFYLWGVLWGF
jgi:hypothetical protein